MLYVFSGFPRNGLHAGGLQFGIETVEHLAILDHDPAIQYRKEGVHLLSEQGEEWINPVEYLLSPICLRDGITWDWFPEDWTFGNGVTVHKTLASPEFKSVVHGTDLTLDEFLAVSGTARLGDIELERKHIRHEGWDKYEARWVPGTCPQESHIVHLTWLITTHRLPEFAYRRISELIESPTGILMDVERYSREPGKHFTAIRRWDGKPAYAKTN